MKFYKHNKEKDIWEPVSDTPPMEGYQDPTYIGEISGQKYFSVVNTEEDPKTEVITNYWAELFVIKGDLNHIEPVAKGPLKSKGLHLIQTPQGIEGFIRMQGEEFGKGKVCHFRLPQMADLQDTLENIREKTEIIEMFDQEEWGGVNDLHLLSDGRIGILGHIARFDKNSDIPDKKDYYVTSGIFDPKTKTCSDLKIIMTAEDLGIEYDAKRPDLQNVLYPTNSILDADKLHVYANLGDTKAMVFTVENPWQEVK